MIRIKSLSHFVKCVVKERTVIHEEILDYSYTYRYYYRGHSDCEYKLLPSIARNDKQGHNNLNYEKHMVNRALLRNPVELSNINNRVNLLAKLQHYGLETRLLDITENALVALYFACSSNPDLDGEVITFKVSSDSIKYPESELAIAYCTINSDYTNSGSIDEILDMLSNYLKLDKSEKIKKLTKYHLHRSSPIVINHAIQSEREIRQQAGFLLFPNLYDKTEEVFKNEIAPLDKNNGLVFKKYIIPKELKSELIQNLKCFGITQEYIFPEFENRCKSINKDIREFAADNTALKASLRKSK